MNDGMNVVFRCDSSLRLGNGHVMRCLTLAEALRAQGACCRFVSRDAPGSLHDAMRKRGFGVALLPTQALSDADTDAALTIGAIGAIAAIGGPRIDWLVLDHYALDARWARLLRPACRRLLVIDDLANRGQECDLLLDQNLGRQPADYAGLVPPTTRLLTGPHHALLRPAFAQLRPPSLARRAHLKIEHLLISMGGVDAGNASGQVLQALQSLPAQAWPGLRRISVVLGPFAPGLASVRALASALPWPTTVEVDPPHLAALMADSDLALGASGSSAWERCCLGLPTIALVLADNQRAGATALAGAGAVALIEPGDSLAPALHQAMAALRGPAALQAMQQAAAAIADGNGADRVLAAMLYSQAERP